jgi:CRP/FNR family transcriptional regulator
MPVADVPHGPASVTFLHAASGGPSLVGHPLAELDAFAAAGFNWRVVKRGESAYQAGDRFNAIYGVRSGFFKIGNVDAMGHEQIVGFFMRGELFGLDGIGAGRYDGTATALEDSEIAVAPFRRLEAMAQKDPALQRQLHGILSREITREHGVMMLLGSMNAEERLAAFLLNLSKRFLRRGYSPSEFHLRMTREEIGSYIGLKLETVSRLFSLFEKRGLLAARQKHIVIADSGGLERLLHPTA